MPALTLSARVSQVVQLRDDDHESSRLSNCCGDFAPDFGASLRSTSVTASVDLAFPRCGEGEPWCRYISVARASIRSQGLFGLSVWPGGQFPVSGSSVWRPRSLVAVATRRRAEMGCVDFVRVPISGGKWVTLALHTNALRAPIGHKYQDHLVR